MAIIIGSGGCTEFTAYGERRPLMEKGDRITIDPEIQGGKPVISGTRLPVEVVLGSLGGGMTIEEVCKQYRIKKEDVLAGLKYATEVLAQERVVAVSR